MFEYKDPHTRESGYNDADFEGLFEPDMNYGKKGSKDAAANASKGKVEEKIDGIKAKADKVMEKVELFQKPENQKTFKLVKEQVIKVLKHVLPRKFILSGKIGLEDPKTTGYIAAAAGALMPFFGNNIDITAIFDEEVLDGKLDVKGRVRLFWIAKAGIVLLLDKNFRNLVFKKGKNKTKGQKA